MKSQEIHAEWARIGGGFTVAPAEHPVDLEELIVRTCALAPGDARLFWVAASWLGVHHDLVHMRRLGRHLGGLDDPLALAVAGALFGVVLQLAPTASRLRSAAKHCRPLDEARPLFDALAANPVLLRIAREGSLEIFARWGFWQHEITSKPDAIRPIEWVLAHCPEFRMRAIFGAELEAEIVDTLLHTPAAVSDLSDRLGVTYAAAHEAAAKLVRRGLARRSTEGRRKVLVLAPGVAEWLRSFPVREANRPGRAA
jgi:hypothetical protein